MAIVWALFESESAEDASHAPSPALSHARYLVGQVVQIRGFDASAAVPAPGSHLRRWEGPALPAPRPARMTPARPLTAVSDDGATQAMREARRSHLFQVPATIQQLHYTGREEREELKVQSSQGSGPCAVIIPIRKSEAWWAMAQDERQSFFTASKRGRGHTAIGFPYADRIFRRLYHARYVAPAAPGNEAWDFVTYFEFAPAHEALFRALLAELRDPLSNPEWTFVEREMEIWTTRLSA